MNRRTTFTHERVSLKFDLMLLLEVGKFYGDFNVHMVQRCCSCMFVYFHLRHIICLNIGQGVLCRSIYISLESEVRNLVPVFLDALWL